MPIANGYINLLLFNERHRNAIIEKQRKEIANLHSIIYKIKLFAIGAIVFRFSLLL